MGARKEEGGGVIVRLIAKVLSLHIDTRQWLKIARTARG
jgi:hypothetical protein